MSGETESQVSGWTVDTLHEHLLRVIGDGQDAQRRELTNTQAAYQQAHSDLREMLGERYATQTKALDAAFLAQQTAMRTALEAAEKAVQTALVSAEKAVAKAEVAAEKRFESVNEFRAQLTDQAASFPTRNEVDVRLTAISEKLETESKRGTQRAADLELRLTATTSDLDKRVTSRLDIIQGSHLGTTGSRAVRLSEDRYAQADRIALAASQRATASLAVAGVLALVSVIAVIYSIVHG